MRDLAACNAYPPETQMPQSAFPQASPMSVIAPRRPLLAALCALLTLSAGGDAVAADLAPDSAAATRLMQAALQSGEAYALVSSLTTEVGPRFAGTPGDKAGVDWAVRNLRRMGFSNLRTPEVFVPRWVRGSASFSVLEPFAQSMPAVAIGGSVGTADTGLTGEIVAVKDIDALRALPAGAVSGKIVYFSGRTERTRDGSGYGRAVRSRTEGPSAASALGAMGIVIRSISTSSNRLPHTGTLVYNIAQPRIPAVAISNPDADALERQLATGKKVSVNMVVTARDLPQVRSANVIAEFPGTDLANEIVLIGAHLDSWDLGTGALDDGAGVAIAMAAAKLASQAEPRPRRTIRVVLFANEEFGLSGAARYPADEGNAVERHAIAMEADTGAGPVFRLGSKMSAIDWPLILKIHGIVAPLGVELGDNETGVGADIQPLRRQGVPIISPQLDASLYFDVHHTANDTLDKVDPNHIRQSTAVFAVSAYLAAMAPKMPQRLPPPPPR